MGFWDVDPGGYSQRVRDEEARVAAAARERALSFATERHAIVAQWRRGVPDARLQLVDSFAREHRITVTWLYGASPYAIPARRRIVLPPLRTDADFGVALHEVGHVVHPCSGRPPHLRTQIDDRQGNCLGCEVTAWRFALNACPFTREMARVLEESLATYADAPAWAQAVAELKAITSPATFMRNRDRHFAHLDRVQRQRAVERSCARDRAIEQAKWEALYA